MNVNCASLARLLQLAARRSAPAATAEFQYTRDNTLPCAGAFGGGAYVVTAMTIDTMRSAEWLDMRMVGR